MKISPALICLLFLAGCPSSDHAPAAASTPEPKLSMFPTPPSSPRDASAEPAMLVHLSVYRVAVPAWSITRNDEFWKHVTEDGLVNIAAHDRMFNNGFRVGVAPRSDWEYFKNIIESNNLISQETRSASVTASTIELPLRPSTFRQLITYFHPTNGLVGQIYDRCENALTVRFEPAPRNPGVVRVTATPLLRSEKTELVFTVRNESHELKFVNNEYLFDLNLSVDIPVDHFLIIAPSAESEIASSLGRRFLFLDGEGQEFEQLLIISPQPFQLERKGITTQPSTMPTLGRK